MKIFSISVALSLSYVTAYGQGTVYFANVDLAAGVDAPVYMSDGVTKLSGPQFVAQLLGGPSADMLAPIATTGFLTGTNAGYYLGGNQAINNVFPGSLAWVAVEVWNRASGGSFEQAKASALPDSWWSSSVFSVQTQQFNGIPIPVPLTGLGSSPVYLNGVPEPSTFVLTSLGAALVLFRFLRRGQSSSSSRRVGCCWATTRNAAHAAHTG